MSDFLEVTMDGFVFHIPVEIIKEHVTKYLEDEASSQYPENEEEREKFIQSGETYWHNEGLIDWAQNNMDWEGDLEEYAELIEEPEPEEMYEAWARAELKIIKQN